MSSKEIYAFRCEKCGKPAKPVKLGGDYIHLRRLFATSQTRYDMDMCWECFVRAERQAVEANTSELCRRCLWNIYDMRLGKCPMRVEAEMLRMNEKGICQCSKFTPLWENGEPEQKMIPVKWIKDWCTERIMNDVVGGAHKRVLKQLLAELEGGDK